MKKLLLTIGIIMLFHNFMFAQVINIHTTSGTTSFNLADIDSITFSAESTIPTEGLVAYYPFNGNANDESGNGNHGTVNGAALTNDRFGNSVSAYNFNGVDDYILVQNSISLNIINALTISAWVKFPIIPEGGSHILMKSDHPDTYEYGLNLNPQNSGAISASIGGYNVVNLVSNPVTIDAWYHVVATWQYPGISEIYLNGVLNNSTSTIGNIDPINCVFTIGRIRPEQSASSYNGIVDDVRIYNRVLSGSEIQALYHEGGW